MLNFGFNLTVDSPQLSVTARDVIERGGRGGSYRHCGRRRDQGDISLALKV
jgi:hypothetical protein